MTKMNSIILISSQILIQKLALSSKVIEKIKVISLCNLNEILSKKHYFEESFLIKMSLIAQNKTFSLRSLINSDFIIYTLIYINLADKICQKLNLQSISLIKKKLIWKYNKKLFQKIITHKILSNLIIDDHKKLIILMLIADIEHHDVILSKFWMNKNEILLNIHYDTIVFND